MIRQKSGRFCKGVVGINVIIFFIVAFGASILALVYGKHHVPILFATDV